MSLQTLLLPVALFCSCISLLAASEAAACEASTFDFCGGGYTSGMPLEQISKLKPADDKVLVFHRLSGLDESGESDYSDKVRVQREALAKKHDLEILKACESSDYRLGCFSARRKDKKKFTSQGSTALTQLRADSQVKDVGPLLECGKCGERDFPLAGLGHTIFVDFENDDVEEGKKLLKKHGFAKVRVRPTLPFKPAPDKLTLQVELPAATGSAVIDTARKLEKLPTVEQARPDIFAFTPF